MIGIYKILINIWLIYDRYMIGIYILWLIYNIWLIYDRYISYTLIYYVSILV